MIFNVFETEPLSRLIEYTNQNNCILNMCYHVLQFGPQFMTAKVVYAANAYSKILR